MAPRTHAGRRGIARPDDFATSPSGLPGAEPAVQGGLRPVLELS
jgi:hypothetical protein